MELYIFPSVPNWSVQSCVGSSFFSLGSSLFLPAPRWNKLTNGSYFHGFSVFSIFSVGSCFTIATSYYTFVFDFVLFCFFWGGGLFIFNWMCIMKNYVTEINRISPRPIRSNYFTKLRNNQELKRLLWELTYLNPIYNLHYGKSNLVHWFKPLFELCCLFSGSTVFIPLQPVNKEFPIS